MERCPVCEATSAEPFMTLPPRHYWRCLQCRATFLDPSQLPSAEEELHRYNLHNNDPADPRYRAFLHRLADPVLDALNQGVKEEERPFSAQGLDYGSGPAPVLAEILSEAGHQVACYDPFYAPDPTPLEGSYSFITCCETAEHFHTPAREFSRFARLLLPGGLLGIMTEFQDDDDRFARWYYRLDPTHVVFYREETFRYLAGQYGWEVRIPRKNVALFRRPR
ncbi:2-polyprenyl-3-methyl-5-hydroxy-6-metoxy-1,4-benzoquinol methylase [Alkalispirochaeta americana]|uniref:2-polyprenyl-3-methyl-5-hydroxy-6-metoxy-1,4-benzoquinol methylase n=1 Tax=Alkalispirochaeta americana TaxID=159291 RepID=A0A1N6VC23_9SPIO|nr:methyltransferase domain-containing protein [Alkalispirochaeta americana]SIQ75308.1 2-polyprenyl-3-methyl-5-hydroxy-6-metoxy-1,4-benzoquinol methylase [Alkalispirochaeta americana]